MSAGASAIIDSTEQLATSAAQTKMRSRVSDYVELTKPRITILELITVVAAMHVATRFNDNGLWTAGVVAAAIVGTTLLAASANAVNMYLERRLDSLMRRTANRPLPAGRLTPRQAAVFGVATLSVGITLLVLGVNWLTAGVGLASWFLYVAVYTPMKTRSTFNTTVGAVSGALPIVMGWTAGGGGLDLMALGLFGVLMLWQYPHFMAIAWLCKEDYARAGYKMSTVVEPTGASAAATAIAGSAALIPVSFIPGMATPMGAPWYAAIAFLLGLALLAASVAFAWNRNDKSAKRLMRASLLYLPCWLLALWAFLP